ncbi:hypothetical protein C8T65DRAFT_99844 [Cerioporus squamosus]|nr:hypothetical protein C8T65DRAFT_99844 [Cerioporus squamosus]
MPTSRGAGLQVLTVVVPCATASVILSEYSHENSAVGTVAECCLPQPLVTIALTRCATAMANLNFSPFRMR